MDHKVYNKEPMVLVRTMDSYFRTTPPDCSLYSQNNYEHPIHKELLYQTKFMRDMVVSVSPDSKIEIICHSLSKEELEVIVDFLYNGRIFCTSKIAVYRAAKNLRDLFGFPLKQYEISETKDATGCNVKSVIFGSAGSQKTEIRKTQRTQKLNLNTIRNSDPGAANKIETIKVKQELEENIYDPLNITENKFKDKLLYQEINCDNLHPVKVKLSELGEESQQERQKRLSQHITTDSETGLEECNFCQKVFKGPNGNFILMNHIDSVHLKVKSHVCQFCDKKYMNKYNLCTHLKLNHGAETDKVVKCSLCEKDIKNIYVLKRHLRNVHKKKDCSECPICKEVLESQASKMEHVAVKHPERKINCCQHCDFKCLKLTTLKNHHSQKHQEFLQSTSNKTKRCRVCSVCNKELQSKVMMMDHLMSNHPDVKVHSCPVCDDKYLEFIKLEKHISKVHPEHDSDISHTGKKGSIRTCPICKIVFKSRSLMMKHFTSVHPEEKIYSCSLCNYKFQTFMGLNTHVFNRHERKVTDKGCSFCGKEFANKMDLKNHIDIEHKEKKYECVKCDASYLHQRTLMLHIEQVHEGKKHQCTTCGEIFESIGRLETHIAVKHDRSKLFECPSCKAAYTIYQKLEEHIAFVHEKVSGHLCTQCGKNFKIKSSLRDHILVVHEGKKYHCDLCTKTFNHKSRMQSHVKQIHEGKKLPPVTCTQCHKSFTGNSRNAGLKRHIREVHEGKRPHACHLCGLAFSQSGNLKTHIRGKHKDSI